MSRVFVGDVSPAGLVMIESYINKYAPDTTIEPLGAHGVRGKIKNYGAKADVLLIVIDEANYELCKSVAKTVLDMPKTHCYKNDDKLQDFLTAMFGEAVSDSSSGGLLTVDMPSVPTVNFSEKADNEAELESLREKLAQANLLIKNLEQQLKEATSDSDVSDFIKRIRELEEQLEKAGGTSSEEYDKLKEEYNNLQVKLSELTEELENYKDQVISLEGQLSETNELYQDSLKELNNMSQTVGENSELDIVNAKVAELERELGEKDASITSLNADIDSFTEKLNNLTMENGQLQEKLQELEMQLSNSDTLANTRVSEVESELAEKVSEIEKMTEENGNLANEIESLNKTIEELNTTITEKNNIITDYESGASEVVTLRQDLETKDTEIQGLKTSVTDYISKIDDLELQLATKDGELSALTESTSAIREGYDSAVNELETFKASNQELSAKNLEQEEQINNLMLQVDTLEGEKSALDSLVVSMTEQSSEYEQKIAELNQTVTGLNTELDEFKNQRSSDELLEERRKVARLETEINTLKAHGFGVRHDSEVEALKAKIKEMEEDTSSAIEITELTKKVESLEEELALSKRGIAGCIGAFTKPKNIYSVNVFNIPDMRTKVNVFTSGNADSNIILYSALHDYCATSKENIIILDITVDTQIDVAFSIKNPPSPVGWLDGTDSFKNCLSNTKFSNVKAIITGLTHCNSFFLLNIDWASLLSEMDGLADRIIINFGCLTDAVAKLLFNSFTTKYEGIVVIKASPVNLRSSTLNIIGLGTNKNITACCYQMEESAKAIYARLANTCQSRVMKAKDVLKL